jgi:TonB-dependent receptor
MVTGNYNRGIKSRDNYRVEYESTTDTDRPAFWLVGQLNLDETTISRVGGSIRLDYKLSDFSTVFFKGMYNLTNSTLHRQRSLIQPNPSTIPLQVFTHYDANGVARTATNAVARVLPGWTDKVVETINNTFTADQNKRDGPVRNLTVQGGGERKFVSAKLDYDVSYSWSGGRNDRVIMGTQVQNVGFRFEKKPENYRGFASYEQTSGPDIYNWANRRISSYNLQQDTMEDEILGAQVNFRKDFHLPAPTYLKTGLRARIQNREHELERPTHNNYVGGGSIERFHDTSLTYSPFGVFRNPGFLSAKLLAAEFASAPQNFTQNVVATARNSVAEDFSAEEKIYAAYIQGGTRLGRLNILSGIRVEETQVSGTGNVQEITPEEAARRAAWVGTVTPDEQRRRTIAEFGNSKTNKGEYRNVFPSVHFRYDVTNKMVARASYSTGIGRPTFGNLVPRESVNHETQRVSGNNPSLRPQYADNFDLSLEYYYEPAGMVSVGAFSKEINDFLLRVDGLTIGAGPNNGFNGEYAGYELNTWSNGGAARVRGMEVAYQQQFSFLPGFWKGFGFFGNYTWLESEGDFANSGVPGFAPQNGTAGLTYTNYGWQLRLIGTYTAENPGGLSDDPSQQTINLARWNVDLNASYKVNRWLTVFCDVRNLTDEHRGNSYKFIPARQFQFQRFSTEITFGVNGRF